MALHDFNPNTHIGPMPSPCIGLCRMDAANAYCQGCWRSMDEIVDWSVASESKKKHIWLELLTRSAGA